MLNALLSYLTCIPAMVLCFLPMKGKLRFRLGWTLAALIPTFCGIIVLAAYLTWRLGLQENALFLPVGILCFLVYHFSLKEPLIKTLAVFLTVLALLSIIRSYAACFDAVRNPDSAPGFHTSDYYLLQFCVTTPMILLLAFPFAKYGRFVADQPASSAVWHRTTLFSLVVVSSNAAIIPTVYFLFHENRLTANILVLITAELMTWFLMQIILNSAFSSSRAVRKMEEQNRILALQETQFRSQQKYIRDSERVRHDFRHTILTLSELYKAGDIEALGRYLDQYVEVMPKSEFSVFCGNTALNALLNYFVHISRQSGIDLTLRVDLPDELPVSDVDLCSMIGNILENAVAGCRNAEEKEIQLTILSEDRAQLYIVAVNSFDGIVRQSGDRYLSVKHSGEGFGLSSIRSAAESYGGFAQFSHEGCRFFSNVAIPLR